MGIVSRLRRYARLARKSVTPAPTPPFLVLFVSSVCNMKCEHCFYWRSLNRKTDLSFEKIVELSQDLGPIETLYLSGGEPFLRREVAEICRQFIRQNGAREIYVPSNGYFTEKTVRAVRSVLEEPELGLFAVELSLDGMPEFHDAFRGTRNAFARAMATYDALAELQRSDPRLRIHSISTATQANMGEIRKLTTLLYDRCPQMDHHNLAIIRGDRKSPTLAGPALDEYQELYAYIRRLWAPRERSRYGSLVEPMLQWAKVKTAREQRQVVPCRAGRLSAVVYANGDVSICEQRAPLGNLKERRFREIWQAARMDTGACFCTTEIFMWPSITYQPLQLARALVAGRAWQRPRPLGAGERASYEWPEKARVERPVLHANR